MAGIAPGSVDFVFSQAVLEHVALGEFDATIRALHRVQTPGSISSHRVDLQDHLAHSLHSLRFSRRTWESSLFSGSGFYTNRLRASQVVAAFTSAGYQVLAQEADRWPSLPLSADKLHRDFTTFSDAEQLAEDDVRRPQQLTPRSDAMSSCIR